MPTKEERGWCSKMSLADKRNFHIWIISFLSLASYAILVNVWFEDLLVAAVSIHARAAYKLLGTLWPLLILAITSVLFGTLSFWRHRFWGLLLMIFIALFIGVVQGYVLSLFIGHALMQSLQSEVKNPELYYLLHILEISRHTLLAFLVLLSIALWLSEKLGLRFSGGSRKTR
jgi:hypothetical protein